MSDSRKIIHIDMDAFYASVEQLDQPQFRGKPLAVGGPSEKRGVIAAASYEARKYGVRSAMPTAEAFRRCPELNLVSPRFPRYREISEKVQGIFRCYTDLIEPVALDEAWLDVSANLIREPSGTRVAERIKSEILEQTALTCSAGVSYNKFLAKIASEENKPDGLFVITPEQASTFLKVLPVRKIPGVGRVTEEKLRDFGIEITEDLLKKDAEWPFRIFFEQVLCDLNSEITEFFFSHPSDSRDFSDWKYFQKSRCLFRSDDEETIRFIFFTCDLCQEFVVGDSCRAGECSLLKDFRFNPFRNPGTRGFPYQVSTDIQPGLIQCDGFNEIGVASKNPLNFF